MNCKILIYLLFGLTASNSMRSQDWYHKRAEELLDLARKNALVRAEVKNECDALNLALYKACTKDCVAVISRVVACGADYRYKYCQEASLFEKVMFGAVKAVFLPKTSKPGQRCENMLTISCWNKHYQAMDYFVEKGLYSEDALIHYLEQNDTVHAKILLSEVSASDESVMKRCFRAAAKNKKPLMVPKIIDKCSDESFIAQDFFLLAAESNNPEAMTLVLSMPSRFSIRCQEGALIATRNNNVAMLRLITDNPNCKKNDWPGSWSPQLLDAALLNNNDEILQYLTGLGIKPGGDQLSYALYLNTDTTVLKTLLDAMGTDIYTVPNLLECCQSAGQLSFLRRHRICSNQERLAALDRGTRFYNSYSSSPENTKALIASSQDSLILFEGTGESFNNKTDPRYQILEKVLRKNDLPTLSYLLGNSNVTIHFKSRFYGWKGVEMMAWHYPKKILPAMVLLIESEKNISKRHEILNLCFDYAIKWKSRQNKRLVKKLKRKYPASLQRFS